MRLKTIRIQNFRCFGEDIQEIELGNIATFIGANSSGKTAALAALNYMFSPNAAERNLKRSDFHIPANTKPEEMNHQQLFIEAIFVFDELDSDAEINTSAVPNFFEAMVVNEPSGDLYLRIRLDATWDRSQSIDGAIDQKMSFVTCAIGQETENSFKVAQRKLLDKIRFIYIPATRDTSKQLRNVSGTMMGQLMKNVNWSDETKGVIKRRIEELNSEFTNAEGISAIDSSINEQWKNYDFDNRYYNANLRFNGADMESLLKKMEIVFLPTVTGREYTVNEMGDGLKSLFYISMVDSILGVEQKLNEDGANGMDFVLPVITIIAVEEPENHISPHILGRLINNLKVIAEKDNVQVIVTSHSAAIVKRVEPEDIRYFRLSAECQSTVVRAIKLPNTDLANQYKYVKEAVKAYPELYFAKLVILGEGDTEELLLPKFIENINGDIDNSGISVVPLGGRFVNHFWRLLEVLEIPYITLLDLDRERETGGWQKIKYVIDQLIEVGHSFDELQIEECTDPECLLGMKDSDEAFIKWAEHLENFDVYFSAPLDFDFMMLESYKSEYLGILSEREGPRIEIGGKQINFAQLDDKIKRSEEYNIKVNAAVKATLKNDKNSGDSYNQEQKDLMVWYNYFFLNRGKPATHMLMLSQISKEGLKANIPQVICRMCEKINEILS